MQNEDKTTLHIGWIEGKLKGVRTAVLLVSHFDGKGHLTGGSIHRVGVIKIIASAK